MHDLRHEAVSRLGDAGMTSSELRAFSGHTNSSTLDKYVHLDVEKVAKRLAALSA